jgi:hypothetical protein
MTAFLRTWISEGFEHVLTSTRGGFPLNTFDFPKIQTLGSLSCRSLACGLAVHREPGVRVWGGIAASPERVPQLAFSTAQVGRQSYPDSSVAAARLANHVDSADAG